jgi:dihydroorotase
LSTERSVALIREAKQKGLPVSCDVAAHQLAFTDDALVGFDTNLKVNPPFRTEKDRDALRAGLADGTIDVLVSDHSPGAPQNKETEFDHADFGITALETSFSIARMDSGLPLHDLIEKLSHGARHILRLPMLSIAPSQKANLTFFLPDASWLFEKSYSKSQNTPFLNKRLNGRVKGIVKTHWF